MTNFTSIEEKTA